jgi:hypothetical protein
LTNSNEPCTAAKTATKPPIEVRSPFSRPFTTFTELSEVHDNRMTS